MTEATETLPEKSIRRLVSTSVASRPVDRTGDTGREPADELPADSRETSAVPSSGAAKSGAVADADPLAKFVASLSPDQRTELIRLLASS
jgi:hypothetical protein